MSVPLVDHFSIPDNGPDSASTTEEVTNFTSNKSPTTNNLSRGSFNASNMFMSSKKIRSAEFGKSSQQLRGSSDLLSKSDGFRSSDLRNKSSNVRRSSSIFKKSSDFIRKSVDWLKKGSASLSRSFVPVNNRSSTLLSVSKLRGLAAANRSSDVFENKSSKSLVNVGASTSRRINSSSNFQQSADHRNNSVDNFWYNGDQNYNGSQVPKIDENLWYDGDNPTNFTKVENSNKLAIFYCTIFKI